MRGKERRVAAYGAGLCAALVSALNPSAASAALLHCDYSGKVAVEIESTFYTLRVPETWTALGEGPSCLLEKGELDADNPGRRPCVALLQRALRDCAGQPIAVDGVFGSETARALRNVQTKLGLPPDGVYGPDTARRLYWPATPATGGPTRCVSSPGTWVRSGSAEPLASQAPDETLRTAALARDAGEAGPTESLIDFGPFRMELTNGPIREIWWEGSDGSATRTVSYQAEVEEMAIRVLLPDADAPSHEHEPLVTVTESDERWESRRGSIEMAVQGGEAILRLVDVRLERDGDAAAGALAPISGEIRGPLSRRCMILRREGDGPTRWVEDREWRSDFCDALLPRDDES